MSWDRSGAALPSVETQREVPATSVPAEVAKRSAALPFLVAPANPARAFSHIPTYAVGMAVERRQHARAGLRLPLRLTRVNSAAEPVPVTLLTRNISSNGVYFLAPKLLEPGMAIELEVALVERPVGRGGVRMAALARVVRVEPANESGWHGIAATFDDMAFQRDEAIPARYLEA